MDDAAPGTRQRAARALRDLGAALVGHEAPDAVLDEIAEWATRWSRVLAAGAVRRRGADAMVREMFGAASPDGVPFETFADCFVSGSANPTSMGLVMRRDGDAAAGSVVLGPPFEGAPGRAHGGAVAALCDDALSYALCIAQIPAYTAVLTVRYVAPTPVGVRMDVRARVRDGQGRRVWVDAELSHSGRPVASATGLMITF